MVSQLRTTICIKSFNRPKLVQKAIRSCVDQTVPCQVLVVDDGSGFETLKSLRAARAKHPNVTIIELGENAGPSNANNIAISLAQTSYLGFLDSDDELEEHFVEVMEKALDRNEWADFAYCRFTGGPRWGLEGRHIFDQVLKQGHLSALGTLFGRVQAFQGLPALPTREDIGRAADACDDDRLSFEASRCSGIVHVPRELYHYQSSEGNRLTGDPELMLVAWSRFFFDYRHDYIASSQSMALGAHLGRVLLQFGRKSDIGKLLTKFLDPDGAPVRSLAGFMLGFWATTARGRSQHILDDISRMADRAAVKLKKFISIITLRFQWRKSRRDSPNEDVPQPDSRATKP